MDTKYLPRSMIYTIWKSMLPCFKFSTLSMFSFALMQLGPKVEDVKKPVNPFVFLYRFILGTIASTYFVLVPIYMWIKDKIVPRGMPI